jgi:hypothetical protein
MIAGVVEPIELLLIGDQAVGVTLVILDKRARPVLLQRLLAAVPHHAIHAVPIRDDALDFGS